MTLPGGSDDLISNTTDKWKARSDWKENAFPESESKTYLLSSPMEKDIMLTFL